MPIHTLENRILLFPERDKPSFRRHGVAGVVLLLSNLGRLEDKIPVNYQASKVKKKRGRWIISCREKILMEEERPENLPQTIQEYRDLPCSHIFSNESYGPPSPWEIKQLIKLMGWSGSDVARLTGPASNPKTASKKVRGWTAPTFSKNHSQIPYAAWQLMLLEAGVIQYEKRLNDNENTSA